jgi:hypothetical protein
MRREDDLLEAKMFIHLQNVRKSIGADKMYKYIKDSLQNRAINIIIGLCFCAIIK